MKEWEWKKKKEEQIRKNVVKNTKQIKEEIENIYI